MKLGVLMASRFAGYPARLDFTVDEDTLELSGPDADTVRAMMEAAVDAGVVTIDPYPTSIAISDPLSDRGQFAAVLAEAYPVPGWMRAWIPPDPAAEEGEGDDDGASVTF